MTTRSSAVVIPTLFLAAIFFPPPPVHALGGSAATLAVVYGSATTVCSIVAGEPVQRIQCWRNGQLAPPILPNTSFDAIAGGRDTLCGVRSGGFSVICWNTTFTPKRIYRDTDDSSPLTFLTIGDTQICGLRNTTAGTGNVICWRGEGEGFGFAGIPNPNSRFRVISSGLGFSCGVLQTTNRALCWGDPNHNSIQSEFENSSMADIHVGGRHACGIDNLGFVICRGDNSHNQLNIPSNSAYEYRDLALGENHSCAIRRLNRTAVCWGRVSGDVPIAFEVIVSGPNFTCGLVTANFTVLCWGPGWPYQPTELPLSRSLPGPCIDSPCPCNLYPDSHFLCSANGHICRPCDIPTSIPIPFPPPPHTPSSGTLTTRLLVFVIVGSIGGFAGICSAIYCLHAGVCFGKKKVHNSVQPTISAGHGHGQQLSSSSNPSSRSSTLRRQSSILMKRQRSGPSSKPETAEEYSFSELAAATDNFSLQNKIGAGSFGVVYRGKLRDGREVAIKRSESGPKTKKFQEKETAFDSELAFLSRLHHKHLVRLFGYCEENEERLLVYEYMKNGALYDHLHDKNNVEKSSNVINSWKVRIKILLDAARGIEYLHNYADPPIIHRDIKSSNILLDGNWGARVSDFGLSLLGPVGDGGDRRPVKAAGTVGYIDPEYYGLSVLTAKSDVYGFGVVMLEVLTGRRAVFRAGEEPVSVVDYAVGRIMAGELEGVLDGRVGGKETEAVELVAYTAVHCVNLEGKDRPTMTDVVGNLERAVDLCEGGSYGSISSGSG